MNEDSPNQRQGQSKENARAREYEDVLDRGPKPLVTSQVYEMFKPNKGRIHAIPFEQAVIEGREKRVVAENNQEGQRRNQAQIYWKYVECTPPSAACTWGANALPFLWQGNDHAVTGLVSENAIGSLIHFVVQSLDRFIQALVP